MRQKPWEFLKFWLFQGLAVWVIMLPSSFLLTTSQDKPINLIMLLGMVIWIVGLTIETIADWQKFSFKNLPKNKDLWIQSGIWKYSRHPNYFGEMLSWWGIFVFALPFIQGLNYFIIAGPLFITFILMFVSGIPLLEKKYDAKYANNQKYQKYKSQTSLLIPLPIKT